MGEALNGEVMMKCLYLSLLLIFSCPILSFDADDGGIEETKGQSQDDNTEAKNLDFKLGSNAFSIPSRIVKKFDLFKDWADIHADGGLLDFKENDVLNIDDLRLLLQVVNDEVIVTDFKKQKAMINLASFLMLNDGSLLDSFLNSLKDPRVIDADIENKLEWAQFKPFYLLKELKKIENIHWRPDGKDYFALYSDSSAQRFDKTGTAIGARLTHICGTSWQPNGKGYFIFYLDGHAQYFNENATALGAPLINAREIYWQPNGKGYFISYYNK